MRTVELGELKKMAETKSCVDWIPAWGEDSLISCFSLHGAMLEAGETIRTREQAAFLASGSGLLNHKEISAGRSFGFRLKENGCQCVEDTFQAEERSILLCLESNIFDRTCFGMGCGSTHYRMRELLISHLE